MMMANMSHRIDEVQRGPVVVREGVPDSVVVVYRDWIVHSHFLRRPPHIDEVVLEGELRCMYPEHHEPVGGVFFGPASDIWELAQPIDARVRPEVDEYDPPCRSAGVSGAELS